MTKSIRCSAIALAISVGWALPAHAAPADNVAIQQELAEMRAQMSQMAQRIDTLETQLGEARAQAAAAADQAAMAANQATTAAQASSSAVAAVEAQASTVDKAVKATSWAADTKISGRMYFNISAVSNESNGVGADTVGGFEIKRFYLGVDHTFNKTFSGNVTADISNITGVGRAFYVKKAYLQAKISPALVVRLGAADLPWVPFIEGQYGYRHVENVMIDRTKFGTSADWGVHVMGELADGMVSYQVSAIDGAGYRNPQFSKSIDLEGRVSVNYHGFFAGVGGYVGKLGKNKQGTPTYHTASRIDAALGYKTKVFTIGGEYFHASNWNNVTTVASDAAEGFTVFGSYAFEPEWSVFGRFDYVRPNLKTMPSLRDYYFNVGVQYSPAKIVDLALVYKREPVDNGLISTSNGTIGGSIDGAYSEIGLFGQFRF